MDLYITGPNGPYEGFFEWKIAEFPAIPIGENVTKIVIELTNIRKDFIGGGAEVAQISFLNATRIQDLNNNTMNSVIVEGSLSPYSYVAPGTQSAISGGGKSLQYTFLSVIGF